VYFVPVNTGGWLPRGFIVPLLLIATLGAPAPASAGPPLVKIPPPKIAEITLASFDLFLHSDSAAHLHALVPRRLVRIGAVAPGAEVALDLRLLRNGKNGLLRGFAVVGVKRGGVKPIKILFIPQHGATINLKPPRIAPNVLSLAAAGGRGLSRPANAFLMPTGGFLNPGGPVVQPGDTLLDENVSGSQGRSMLRSSFRLTSSRRYRGYDKAQLELFNSLGLGEKSRLAKPPTGAPPLPPDTPPAERFWLRAKVLDGSIVHPPGINNTGNRSCGVSPAVFLHSTAPANGSAFWFETRSASPAVFLSNKVPGASIFYPQDGITAGYGSNAAGYMDVVVGAESCSEDRADVGGQVVALTSRAWWRPRSRT